MSTRSALLINCSVGEAREMHERAGRERRTLSAHVVMIVMRGVKADERLADSLQTLIAAPRGRDEGARTTVLLRCSAEEARRIRLAARRRETTISSYVLQALHRWWELADKIPRPPGMDAEGGVKREELSRRLRRHRLTGSDGATDESDGEGGLGGVE